QRAIPAKHQCLGGGEIAVEIDGADKGFKSVFEDRGAVAAAGVLLAFAEAKAGIETEAAGHAGQEFSLGKHGATAAEHALALGWIFTVERGGQDEMQDRVTEEFQALVVRR